MFSLSASELVSSILGHLGLTLDVAVHVAQCYMYRMWWIIPTILFAGVLEIIGWVCRLWSSYDPYLSLTYTIQ